MERDTRMPPLADAGVTLAATVLQQPRRWQARHSWRRSLRPLRLAGSRLTLRGLLALVLAAASPFFVLGAAEDLEALDDLDLGAAGAAEEPGAAGGDIPDKVGAEVHLSKSERSALKKLECPMCKAIISEMHVEVTKHAMTAKGAGSEVQVWETSNAICLALLQKYRLDLQGPTLERKESDDEDAMAGLGANPDAAQGFMRAMLVLKMGCQRWIEDYGGDTSGYIFKVVRERSQSAEGAALEFCSKRLSPPLCGANKRERREKEKAKRAERQRQRRELTQREDAAEKKRKEENPYENLPEDSKAGLQRMLEMARDDPLYYMEDDARQRVLQAQKDLRCDVCRVVLQDSYTEVMKRPKSMRGEDAFLAVVEAACQGGPDLSVPNYFGVEPPPLPPAWTDRFRPHLNKTTKSYVLRPAAKKLAKARRSWRDLAATGRQKPPGAEEGEGDNMMTLACKDILEAARMAEALVEQAGSCQASPDVVSCDAAAPATVAAQLCRDASDKPCASSVLDLTAHSSGSAAASTEGASSGGGGRARRRASGRRGRGRGGRKSGAEL
eukprot:TRINITY_DN18998_c0_g1_i1.p1 TRINITY_DN18998_c0_g1~~TRINITY_DN18998_c0_g1_i1.p1  ORF type:complete len:555 (+),score=152.14 TRINITY_DN18998_c0_g1_i1:43-1707(+)